ncbi:hypothetical protein BDZ89DRAFT_913523, partial [Hymenopellis radicata]
ISDEMITEVYTSFHQKTRESESSDYLKTLSAISASMDNTFKAGKKAVVVGSDKQRTQLLKGGILTILNERNEIMNAVGGDISRALLNKRSKNGSGAEYFSKEEQTRNLTSVYNKWAAKGDVWSAAAPKVHSDQLEHARKGCLTRSRQDVLSDGARIEGSHKGWNSIMRAMPCGLGMFIALSSDFVLRRNVRVGRSRFISVAAHGSHHVRLVNYIASRFNTLASMMRTENSKTVLAPLPTLPKVVTSETFGIVSSAHVQTYETFMPNLKAEASEDDLLILTALENEDLDTPEMAAQHLNIDPALLLIP